MPTRPVLPAGDRQYIGESHDRVEPEREVHHAPVFAWSNGVDRVVRRAPKVARPMHQSKLAELAAESIDQRKGLRFLGRCLLARADQLSQIF